MRTAWIRRHTLLCLLGLSVLGSLVPQVIADRGTQNLSALQAAAFLHGRLDLPHYEFDSAVFRGRYFVPFPPFPSLLLLPLVALLGVAATKATLVSLALTGCNIFVLSSICQKLGVAKPSIPWLLAAFFGGTGYWLALDSSQGVWYFAHIVAVTCLLLAIQEAFGKGRGLPTGLYLGLGFLSRQFVLASAVFLAAALYRNPVWDTQASRRKQLAGFALSLAACLGVYLAFNRVRFGNAFDTGYSHLHLIGVLDERFRKYGLFHPAYFPFNFSYMFLQGFHIEFSPPRSLAMHGLDPFGTSLTFASPFLFTAFRARWDRRLVQAAWGSVLLALVPMLFYYNNGFFQTNAQRFSLDFLPILILLVARATPVVPAWLWQGTIVYAVALNILALCLVPLL